ncbi:hypothetical protein [Vitiosangium sp. GDMCC 1.1324]|uniref:hypothetical protein n=1 Tax=Vitiosangium sp. (strain GDMCC 1.1324) TaxID=2138576 RepID=UPI000D34A3F7|nr:hypothetical protein [Vitiosangium sp. GDMCC 1.1324]PTL85447.1 hypothetical protein DAT35_01635 [Vitiosangium sp. GDMCC 1.1324]
MLRLLTQAEEGSLRIGQERGRLSLSLRNASVDEKIRAYKQLEKRLLTEVRTVVEARELRRRIAEDLIVAASDGSWRLFSSCLRRLEKLGYSTMDRRLLACVMSAMASKGSPAGRRKTAELITDIERRTRGRKYHPALREEIDSTLARARKFAGLGVTEDVAEGAKRHKKPNARGRRSVE